MKNNEPSVKQTIKNVISIWLNRALLILTSIITTPLILHYYGQEATGIWLIASQIAIHLMLLDAGFTNSIVRFLSKNKSLNNAAAASCYLSTAFLSLLGIGALLLLFSGASGTLFISVFEVSSNLEPSAKLLAVYTVVYVAVSLPLRVGYGFLASIHRFDNIQLWESLGAILRISFIYISVTFYEPTLVDLGVMVFGSYLLPLVLIFVDGKFKNPNWKIKIKYFSRTSLSELLSMGGAALLATLSAVLLTQGGSVLAGYLIAPTAVILLAYPLMIYIAIQPFFTTFGTIIGPIAASMAAQNKENELLEKFMFVARLLGFFSILTFVIILLFGKYLINLWLSGPNITESEIEIIYINLSIIFFGFSLSVISPFVHSLLASVGWHWQISRAIVLSLIIGLCIGLCLLYITDLGVVSLAIGIASTLLIRGLIWFPILLSNYFSIGILLILHSILLRPLLIAAIPIGIGLIINLVLQSYLLSDITYSMLISIIISVCTVIFCFWFYILDSNYRFIAVEYIKNKFGNNFAFSRK